MPVSADREELFGSVERRHRELVEALEMLYGHDTAVPLADRLVDLAHTAYLERPHDLHVLDLGSLQPDWLQLPQMVGYAAYTERFAENLKGSRRRSPTCASWGSPTCTSCRSSSHGRATTTAGMPSATTARCGPTSGPWRTFGTSRPRCGRTG